MRGAPWLECVAVVGAFALLAVPVRKLVRDGETAAPTHVHAHAPHGHHGGEAVATWATLHFAHPPSHVHLHQGDTDLWHFDPSGGGTLFDTEFPVRMSRGFAEIVAHVAWPKGTPESVVELVLEPDGRPRRTASAWGRGELHTVLVFQWPEPEEGADD